MHHSLLELLRCPRCGGRFDLVSAAVESGAIRSGVVRCQSCDETREIRDHVLRFRPPDPDDLHFGE